MFALIDCNNFYASCERVFNPALNNLPIVVLSNNDGCVIARSSEAKELGIKMASPAYQLRPLIQQHNVQVFSSNYALYGDMSARVMQLISTYSPEVEIYSIDEIFVKLVGYDFYDLREYGLEMIENIGRATGIPISVGIGKTKALAKTANKLAKKDLPSSQGVYVIDTAEEIKNALQRTHIGDVWGIGTQHGKKLIQMQVNNAWLFTQLPDDWVLKQMTVVGLRLKKDLAGIPTLDLEEMPVRKNVSVTRAFEETHSEFSYVKERVVTYAAQVAMKLRKEKLACNAVYLFVHTNPYQKKDRQYNNHVTIQLPYPTNSSIELAKRAVDGLRKIFKEHIPYHKAGICALELVPEESQQTNLFTESDDRHDAIMDVVDKMNKAHDNKIKFGGQDLQRIWKIRRNHLSRRYTTRLDEIIQVNCK